MENIDKEILENINIYEILNQLEFGISNRATNGPIIDNADQKYKGYALEIEQEIFEEKDEQIGCRNYPTELFSTYYDCDQNYTENWMSKLMPNLVPVWASKSLDDTTIHETREKPRGIGSIVNFLVGMHRSDCPLPCKTTKISAR